MTSRILRHFILDYTQFACTLKTVCNVCCAQVGSNLCRGRPLGRRAMHPSLSSYYISITPHFLYSIYSKHLSLSDKVHLAKQNATISKYFYCQMYETKTIQPTQWITHEWLGIDVNCIQSVYNIILYVYISCIALYIIEHWQTTVICKGDANSPLQCNYVVSNFGNILKLDHLPCQTRGN